MSLLPLLPDKKRHETVWYGGNGNDNNNNNISTTNYNRQETELLVGIPGKATYIEFEVAEIIQKLFDESSLINWNDLGEHPKTNPKRPPEKRFKRHRNYYIFMLNQFRHWWKTSRLLVRLSGGYEFCLDQTNWEVMAAYIVRKRRQAKRALKDMKAIGRGGPSKEFLNNVKPFTRSLRIVLAVARGLEAGRDNRLYEVSVAEAFAFMGNRCSRWVARTLADDSTKYLWLPLSAKFIEPYLNQNSRPVIVTMGFIRAILPFAFSFTGSAIGRKLTFNTYNYANFRWKPVQSVMNFDRDAGVYQDTVLDAELVSIGHQVAVAIGHGTDPVETRRAMQLLGFKVFGAGHGGYAAYRRQNLKTGKIYLVHITPYGPSILDEMPRYIVLERKSIYHQCSSDWEPADATILDAALPSEASIYGFAYSGAFFKNQEWAALKTRFDDTLADYNKACKRLGSIRSLKGKHAIHSPPTDLKSLKEFIRSGHTLRKKRKDKKRWVELEQRVKHMAKLVGRYQKLEKAPKRVILYLEGLDCSAKSSTGGLILSALEACGYAVRTAQHNRPPTPEQRKKPWMDRGRFEYPEDVYGYGEEIPEYTALVWDRGPAGDFVYGNFAELDMASKMKKYEEFRTYDAVCRQEGVMFIKLLFVADKDSIASTLGKRLAHKKIARDLHTWLDANSVEHAREEGLAEIESHIDPTDFVAFNKYKTNLEIFTDFARNTDDIGHVAFQKDSPIIYRNQWTVVNTCQRHPARLELLKEFERQLKRFAAGPEERVSTVGRFLGVFKTKPNIVVEDDVAAAGTDNVVLPVPKNYVEDRHKGLSMRAVFQSMILAALFYMYAYITWKFDIQDYA